MDNCEPLIFGATNVIPHCVLTSTPESVTTLDWLKNEHRARSAKWSDLDNPIVVTGLFDSPVIADYFALPWSNLRPDATVQLKLFETDTSTVDLLQHAPIKVSDVLPLGKWRTGIDGYNGGTYGDGSDVLEYWFGQKLTFQRFELTITHGIDPSEGETVTTTPAQNGDGVLSLEAESGTRLAVGASQWSIVADTAASAGEIIEFTGGGFYDVPGTGPSVSYTFTASQSGSHNVWLLINTTGGDSVHVDLDGNSQTFHFPGQATGTWQWINPRSISLTDGTDHALKLYGRESGLKIDKVVVLPSGDSAPTGTGPTASDFGTIGGNANVQLRMILLGEKLQLRNNFSHGAELQLMSNTGISYTYSGFSVLDRQQRRVRRLAIPLEHLDDSDRFLLSEFEQERAGRGFLVSAYPNKPGWYKSQHSFFGRFETPLSYKHIQHTLHQTNLTIVEA